MMLIIIQIAHMKHTNERKGKETYKSMGLQKHTNKVLEKFANEIMENENKVMLATGEILGACVHTLVPTIPSSTA